MAQINDYALLARRFCFLLVCLILAGCDKTVAWQEELQLSTGETIMIDRAVILEPGSGLPPYMGPSTKAYHIRFRYPAQTGSVIEWNLQRWNFLKNHRYEENPLVLDLSQDKVWFIYTTRTVGTHCIRYVRYQFQKGVWIETPLSDGFVDVRPTNLFLAGAKNVKDGGIISLSEKKAQLRSSSNPASYKKQVGPQQITSGSEKTHCVWDSANQTFEETLIN
jgi:hypothetical protein